MKNRGSMIPGGAIDWGAWTAETQPAKRGREKLTEGQREKLSAAQRASHARKRAAVAAALQLVEPVAPIAPAPITRTVTVTAAIFAAMEPGQWYATRDMSNLSGTNYQACKAFGPQWHQKGFLIRAQNPDWKPPARIGGHQEPKWIYKLSATGEQRHRESAALL